MATISFFCFNCLLCNTTAACAAGTEVSAIWDVSCKSGRKTKHGARRPTAHVSTRTLHQRLVKWTGRRTTYFEPLCVRAKDLRNHELILKTDFSQRMNNVMINGMICYELELTCGLISVDASDPHVLSCCDAFSLRISALCSLT